jgi:hypothetical protein
VSSVVVLAVIRLAPLIGYTREATQIADYERFAGAVTRKVGSARLKVLSRHKASAR